MAFSVADALAELEEEFEESISWAGITFPVIASVARKSSNLSEGGFSPKAGATFTVRAELFGGIFPPENSTLAFQRSADGVSVFTSSYAISEVVQMPGGVVQFVCVAEDAGV